MEKKAINSSEKEDKICIEELFLAKKKIGVYICNIKFKRNIW